MCSICGVIDFKNNDNIDKNTLINMGKTMAHRGPDQNDVFIKNGVGFQHNRLSIMDPQNGLQPMTANFGGNEYTIVYNGEIYNIDELKKDLMDKGAQFRTNCDTEVVLYSYIVYCQYVKAFCKPGFLKVLHK